MWSLWFAKFFPLWSAVSLMPRCSGRVPLLRSLVRSITNEISSRTPPSIAESVVAESTWRWLTIDRASCLLPSSSKNLSSANPSDNQSAGFSTFSVAEAVPTQVAKTSSCPASPPSPPSLLSPVAAVPARGRLAASTIVTFTTRLAALSGRMPANRTRRLSSSATGSVGWASAGLGLRCSVLSRRVVMSGRASDSPSFSRPPAAPPVSPPLLSTVSPPLPRPPSPPLPRSPSPSFTAVPWPARAPSAFTFCRCESGSCNGS